MKYLLYHSLRLDLIASIDSENTELAPIPIALSFSPTDRVGHQFSIGMGRVGPRLRRPMFEPWVELAPVVKV